MSHVQTPSGSTEITIRFFGLPCVSCGGVPLKIVSSRGVLEMLARIAHPAASAHERDAVAFDVWPDLPASEARAALRRHLHYLDRALAAAGAPALVVRSGTRLAIDAAAATIDTRHFADACTADVLTQTALAAYGGDYLESYDAPWIVAERERLRAVQRGRLRRACERALEAGDPATPRARAAELRRLDPAAEDALRLDMRARAADGDVAGALAECDAFAARLHAEFGVMLDAPTLALRASIAASRRAPRKLIGFPADHTRFFGRERDIAGVAAALRTERLVTVTGPPGIGKTRLALRAAAAAAEHDAVVACFVDVSVLRESEAIAAAVLAALPPDGGGAADWPDVERALAGRELLVVVDNCERAITAVRAVIARILGAVGNVRIVATSRVLLELSGECLWPLEPLPLHHTVELFFDRLRLVRPHLKRTGQTHERALAMCRRLDGLPLAVELAAARLRSTSLHAVTPPAAPLSLHAAFAWSIELLSANEQRLFRRMACFAGDFSAADAAGVDGEDQARTEARLARLVDHSLVQSPGVAAEFPRYRLLEPLREFAAALLADAGEERALRERHARTFAQRYVARSDELCGPRVHECSAEIERDRGNVHAALQTLIDDGVDPALGARLCLALQHSWFMQGFVVEAVRWAERLLDREDLEAGLRIELLLMRAVMARHQFDYREAIRRYRELLAHHRAAGDARRVALMNIHLAGCLCVVGETDAGKAAALDALAALEPGVETYFTAHAYVALGLAENYAGRAAEAEAAHREALARFVAAGSAADVAVCLSNIATCALERDDVDAAETYAADSIEHAEAAHVQPVIGASLCVLANVAVRRRDLGTARARARAALVVAREMNDYERLAEVFEAAMSIAVLEPDAAFAARLLGIADGLRARCFAVRPQLEARAIDAVAAGLRERLEAGRFDALRTAGGTLGIADALAALRAFLAEPNLAELAR
jgi:predicted ATPase/DNA-binding SARP family transcriptional activator